MPGDGGVFFAEASRDGANIMTTRCRLLCHDLDCGAEFVWRRFGLLTKLFDLVDIRITTTKTISGKLLAIGFAATMWLLSAPLIHSLLIALYKCIYLLTFLTS